MPPPQDYIEILNLIARYAWCLGTGDAEALSMCFTPDGEAIEEVFEDPDIWKGRDKIKALSQHYANAPGFAGPTTPRQQLYSLRRHWSGRV